MEIFSYILQQLINGIQLGSVYALIALGYTMVYGILRMINFAHGDVFMLGAFFGYYLISKFNLTLYLTIISTMLGTATIAFLIEKVAYRPLRKKSAPNISLLITAVGVSLFIEYFFSLKILFSPDYIAFPRPFDVLSYDLTFFVITNIHILIFITTFITLFLLYLLIYKTKQGKAMRALALDPEMARLVGIDTEKIISFTFMIGGALAGLGGILYAIAYPQINVFMGIMPGIKSFIAAVLGGIGVIHGAVLGGFIIGISEVFVSAFLSSTMRDGFIFVILFIFLFFRPNGIFGKRIEKV